MWHFVPLGHEVPRSPRLGAELNGDLPGQYGCAIEEVFSRLKGVA